MAAAVAAKQISARELLELHLDRIEQVNPKVNALVSIDPDRAMQSADEADAKTMRGETLGPLHGVPYAVKDTHDVANWRTTYGSTVFAEHFREYAFKAVLIRSVADIRVSLLRLLYERVSRNDWEINV